jgi:RNA polymerase sigma-70 factor (ECF subfamily)
MIAQAEAALRRAAALGAPGRFQLEAAIQSVHAARAATGRTDHAALLALYGALRVTAPSVGAAVGHAAALGAAGDPAAGLALLDALPPETCAAHQPCWAVRADLLARLSRDEPGRAPEARAAYARAAGLSEDPAVRRFLIAQAART